MRRASSISLNSFLLRSGRLGITNKKIRESSQPVVEPPQIKFRRTVSVRTSVDSDDEGSVINGPIDTAKTPLTCGSCKTKESTVWWKGPKSLSAPVMCDNCGITWRKYGEIRGPPKQEDPPAQKKALNGTAEKRPASPPPAPPVVKKVKVSSNQVSTFGTPTYLGSAGCPCCVEIWSMCVLPQRESSWCYYQVRWMQSGRS